MNLANKSAGKSVFPLNKFLHKILKFAEDNYLSLKSPKHKHQKYHYYHTLAR